MKKRVAFTLFLILPIMGWAFSGTKEEVIRLQSDVLQLQNLVRTLQKSSDVNYTQSKDAAEQLNDHVAKTNLLLQSLITTIREQKGHSAGEITQLHEEMQNLLIKLDDTNNRVASIYRKLEEKETRRESLRITSPIIGIAPKPDQLYHLAYNDYLAGNYELAISGFRDFLSQHTESEYADNAAFYLGICHQLMGKNEEAIRVFDEVINMYPQSDMVPSSHYKKAIAQMELQQNGDAMETFSLLMNLYPESQEAQLAKKKLESLGVEVN